MRNAELIRKVADKVASEPHNYNQQLYICDTKGCIAGHALVESGYKVDETGLRFVDVGAFHIAYTAALLMGLSLDEANVLFHQQWEPAGEGPLTERVQKALYALADGASVEDITA